MEQLSSLDQQFLAVENATNTGHVGGVYLLEAPVGPDGPVTLAALRAVVADRAHLAPPLRRRLVEVPFGLDRPYWLTVDPDLDLHLHEHRLGAPGDDRALAALIATLHETPLDRSRPLWELHLVHGLAQGRQAVYGKVHHAAVDGVSGGAILGALVDAAAVPAPRPPAPAATDVEICPAGRHLLGRGLVNVAGQPRRALRSIRRLLPHLDDLPGADRLPGVEALARAAVRLNPRAGRSADLPARPRLRVPSTPFNAPVSAQRSFAFASVTVRDIRAVRSAFGCADNDVVLALCAGVLREWLIGAQALPEEPLVVGVPASLRGRSGTARDGATAAEGGNRVSLMVVPLPTQEVEPAQRLRAISAAMLIAKRRLAAMPGDWLTDITDLVPPPLAGVAARSVGRMVHGARWHPVNLVISHVPGPQVPLYLAGAKMLAHYPISAVSDALGGLNITVVGHDGDLDFGFVACPRLVPDVWGLAAALPRAMRELLDCAPAI